MRAVTWHAVVSAGTSSLPMDLAAADFSSRDKTHLRRQALESSSLLPNCRHKKVAPLLGFVSQQICGPLSAIQPRMSSKISYPPLLFPCWSLKSPILRRSSKKRTFSTLNILLRLPVSLIQTLSKKAQYGPCGQLYEGFLRILGGGKEPFLNSPLSLSFTCRRHARGAALPRRWPPLPRTEQDCR